MRPPVIFSNFAVDECGNALYNRAIALNGQPDDMSIDHDLLLS
ncbi:hypothetical protein SynBOUM118_00964 [Synechococcus sp. BOUM118]|nr:hypothetical protein SynBOUM118_00964 [Synechococcus sp. BOUM118]